MSILYKSQTIIIRNLLPEEESLFLDHFDDSEIARYIPNRSSEQYIELFKIALQDNNKGIFNRWGIYNAADDDFIGVCLARHFAHNPDQLEIGYTLSKRYWGKGIGTEVSKALVQYCFEKTDNKEIVAVTDLDNIGSQKVLLKAGFMQLDNLIMEEEELAYFMIKR